MYLLNDVIKVLEEIAPPRLAESWDNVGLMLGSKEQSVSRILCALDVNEEVISEAVRNNVQCIITHHPLIFKPLYKIDFDTPTGRMIQKLICHDISVYTMHTNYDIVQGGINDILCEKLDVCKTKVLHISHQEELYKIAVYVPETHYEQMRDIIIAYDVCHIGAYKGCTFTVKGEGTFVPVQGSNPYLGEHGQLEKVNERKIEFITYQYNIETICQVIRKHHPYEEVAFDIYTLNNRTKLEGIGRYGYLKQEIPLEDFILKLKEVFKLSAIRMSGSIKSSIKKVAVCSGSGASFIKRASEVADAYITSDIKFHDAQEAKALGITVFDIGHYTSENIAMQHIASSLNNRLKGLCATSSQVSGEVIYIK